MKIRTFIALELEDTIRHSIRDIQNNFKKIDAGVSWVKPHNVHITLKFLGDVKVKKIDDIKDCLDTTFQKISKFDVEFKELGAFPSLKKPKVIWLGAHTNSEKLIRLANTLENNMGQIGFKKEKRAFSPHITLGRVRTSKNLDQLITQMNSIQDPGVMKQTMTTITLFKSTLTSQGPIYESLHQVKLV